MNLFLGQNPWALKHHKSLSICKMYYFHFIFEVVYHYFLLNYEKRGALKMEKKTFHAF